MTAAHVVERPRSEPGRPQPPYEQLADVYDLLTAGQPHAAWLGRIERLARAHGLAGRRVLDVACGTGKSFLPLLDAGWSVTACDLSPAMAARAHDAAAGRADVRVVDMRELPILGCFDLVLCLNDGVNHLTASAELEALTAGVARNLRPGGLFVFDVTMPPTYADAADAVVEGAERLVVFHGSKARADGDGHVRLVVDVFAGTGDGPWARRRFEQAQRCWPVARLRRAIDAAGLEVVDVLGQRPGGHLEPTLDEAVHPKALLVAHRPLLHPDAKEAAHALGTLT